MKEILFFSGIMLISTVFSMVGTLGNFTVNEKRFYYKKIIDIVVVLLNYLSVVALYNIFVKKSLPITDDNIYFCGILTISVSFINLYTCASQLPMFEKYSSPVKTKGTMAIEQDR